MKTRVLFAVLMGFGLWGNTVFAQKKRVRIPKLKIEFKEKKVVAQKLRAPEMGRSDKLRGNTKLTKERWLQLRTSYKLTGGDPKDKWVDNLEVKWKIYLPATPERKRPILLEKSVTYLEAPVEMIDMPISVYFRPLFVDRYMKDGFKNADIAVMLEFKANGEEIKTADAKSIIFTCGSKPPKKSVWDYEGDKVHKVENIKMAVLNKAETPFAFVESSDFLTIKKED